MTQVVAALIRNGEKFMICRRPANKARGLLWEFVGGKVEPGESKEQALIRECREELAIDVLPAGIFTEVDHIYPDIAIHLTLFNCTIASGEPQLLEHDDLKWITPDEIPQYDFCPADDEILSLIRERFKEIATMELCELTRDKYGDALESAWKVFMQSEAPDCPVSDPDCPCKRVKCPRHGNCFACREHHNTEKHYPVACERPKKASRYERRMRNK